MTALKLLGETDIKHVTATAGPEQEYFVVDEALYGLRPDLSYRYRVTRAGRFVPGASPRAREVPGEVYCEERCMHTEVALPVYGPKAGTSVNPCRR